MPRESGGLVPRRCSGPFKDPERSRRVKTRQKTNAENSNVPATVDELLSEIGMGIAHPVFPSGVLPLSSAVIK